MFIMDASNSMWGRIDGKPKIEIAKKIVSEMAATLPEGTKAGLIAYGHRFDHKLNDCSDMELVGGYGTYSPARFTELLNYVVPKGQTPIASTLTESVGWVSMDGAQSPTVVLITDGVESCGGDPCGAAKKLAEAGVNTRIHVVGYDLKQGQREQVQCIAENGNGKYFDARNADGLKDALNQVKVEIAQAQTPAVQPAPAKPEPIRNVVFSDDFNGEALSSDWTVINEDQDTYIVEDGKVMLVSSKLEGLNIKESTNILQLPGKLPTGDWDINVDLNLDMQTGKDRFMFGLWKDHANYLAINYWHNGGGCNETSLRIERRRKDERTKFDTRTAGSKNCNMGKGNVAEVIKSQANDGMTLTLSKRGREYTASVLLKGVGDESGKALSFKTEALTSLRVPGDVTMSLGKWDEKANGDVISFIDRIEIVSVAQ